MDYVVGSVAALVSGNVTPSRPKLLKRALTPTKHQPSPNVTPKSEYVDDRSIFLSPTLQKKKAIVKKSPKRIFQNPDLDTTVEEGKNCLTSPVVDKAKKHLKEHLETEDINMNSPKSPQKTKVSENNDVPLKKKRKRQSKTQEIKTETIVTKEKKEMEDAPNKVRPTNDKENINQLESVETDSLEKVAEITKTKKSKKKKNKKVEEVTEITEHGHEDIQMDESKSEINIAEENEKLVVNPNAITAQDTDSEHESDHEIHSEDDHKASLDTGPADSSDEEEQSEKKKTKKAKELKTIEEKVPQEQSDDEVKRTLFIGNVLYKPKTKKDIKKLFSQYGDIDTVRIRAVPVKDATMTPKLAIIKNELHPERTTVNVYVKFQNPESVDKALAANNTVLDGHHLRVTRSDITGTLDTKCSIFIGNLPFAIEDEALRAKFEKCGEIESVRIVRDEKTGAGKGFGYVNFKSKDAVELALALSEEDLTIKNRILRVNRCLQIHSKKSGNKNRNSATNRNNGDNRNGGSNRYGGNNRIGNNRNGGFDRNAGNRNFGNRNIDSGNRGFNRNTPGKFDRNAPGKFDRNNDQHQETAGAFRRIANKRKNQDENGGPNNKRGKKERKEFVGRTAEKKKKGKFNKGQKKKKALSEILTK